MPFVLSKDRATFKYTVRVKQPRESGRLEVFEFTAEFKRRSQPEITKILTESKSDRALLDTEWVGWGGVKALVDQDGVKVEAELPVTAENREVLLQEPGVEVALAQAWMDACVLGPRKNSAPPAPIG